MRRLTLTHLLLSGIAALLAANLGYQFLDDDSTAPTPVVATNDATATEIHDVLRAKLIELVDENGQPKAQLYLGEDGAGNLRLRDPSGEVRVKLGATEEGAGLLLLDGDVEPAVQLGADSAGTRLRLAQKGKAATVIAP